jgi:hypothetical protein
VSSTGKAPQPFAIQASLWRHLLACLTGRHWRKIVEHFIERLAVAIVDEQNHRAAQRSRANLKGLLETWRAEDEARKLLAARRLAPAPTDPGKPTR